jgi:hypothetical protein
MHIGLALTRLGKTFGYVVRVAAAPGAPRETPGEDLGVAISDHGALVSQLLRPFRPDFRDGPFALRGSELAPCSGPLLAGRALPSVAVPH